MSSRKRINLTSYATINVGDETHEKVGQDLNQYFRKYNRRMKIYISESGFVYQLPTYIFKLSFDGCKVYLLDGPVFKKFKTDVNNFDIIPEIMNMFENDEVKGRIKLKSILDCDTFSRESQCSTETLEWDYLKAAYATLIDISGAKSFNPLQDHLMDKVFEKLPTEFEDHIPLDLEKLNEMIISAIKISWKMLNLVPPAFISFPTEFNEDWMDRKITIWDENEPHCPSVYSQPILFYNALGLIGRKAAVGNKIDPGKMDIIYMEVQLCNQSAHNEDRQTITKLPSMDEDEMFFCCTLCQSWIFGIERFHEHECLKVNRCSVPNISPTSLSFWEYLFGCCRCY